MKNKEAPVPSTFFEYVKSLGPGLVVALTWLGAGDIVNSATAGGNYGYALMWAFALCVLLRYLFVSLVTKYPLCNPHGDTIAGGLTRLHRWYAPFIVICSLVVGLAVGIYTLAGLASTLASLTGFGSTRLWAIAIATISFAIAFRPVYKRIEKLFYVLAGLLTISLVGLAIWSGPSPAGMAAGLFGFALPAQSGRFDAGFLMVSLVGSVGGGVGNLMYPYFAKQKGWATPAHRQVQRYDLMFGTMVLIVLDLAVWVVGAETLFPKGLHISDTNSLASLLGETMGASGRMLFRLGLFATLWTTYIGNGAAYAYLAGDAWLLFRPPEGNTRQRAGHPVYRWISAYILLSPLPAVCSGITDFVGLTVLVNAMQVLVIPSLVAGVWIITSRERYIGSKYRNSKAENCLAAFLLVLSLVSAYYSLDAAWTRMSAWLA